MRRIVVPFYYKRGEELEFVINAIVEEGNMPRTYTYYPELTRREEFKLVLRTVDKGVKEWCYVLEVK